jgi:hypothetical protein
LVAGADPLLVSVITAFLPSLLKFGVINTFTAGLLDARLEKEVMKMGTVTVIIATRIGTIVVAKLTTDNNDLCYQYLFGIHLYYDSHRR